MSASKFDLSVVVAVHNEEAVLDLFRERLGKVLGELDVTSQIVFVDDGSTDGSLGLLRRYREASPSVVVVALSRNFGKEVAMTAGLDAATGDAVVFIDADLQDPPELIKDFVGYWKRGFENVYGTRIDRSSDSLMKRSTSSAFYSLFNLLSETQIPHNAGDFRLLGPQAVEALRQLRERRRFMKGLYAWIGFPSVSVPYVREQRAGGKTKYNYGRLFNFAIEGISAHSSLVLRAFVYAGVGLIITGVLVAVWLAIEYFIKHSNPSGFYLNILLMIAFSSFNLIGIGIVGEYVTRIYDEVKARPLYLTKRID